MELTLLLLIILVFFPEQSSLSQQIKIDTVWNKWEFLLGTWEGEGSGQPGQGNGYFSFNFELDKNILIRKNHTEIPATKDKPAAIHDDLLIVYKDFKGIANKAIYFDNENHVINYIIDYPKDPKSIIFTSEIIPNVPRFRLSYKLQNDAKLVIKFEFAPPGKPESFSTYLEGYAMKK